LPYRVIPGGASSSRCYLVDGGGNGDYQTIQMAINAAHGQTPTATNRWLVLVGPGTYAESLTLYDYVDVSGLSPGPAVIVAAPTGQYAVATPASCWVSNMRLSGQKDPILLINTSGITLEMDGVEIDESSQVITGIKITDWSTLIARNCDFETGGSALKLILGQAEMYHSRLAKGGSDAGYDAPVYVEDGVLLLDGCIIENKSVHGAGVLFHSNPSTAKILGCTIRKASGTDSVDCDAACANALVAGCLVNGVIDANVGTDTGNTVDASI